ncbi:GAF domain-containing protein [Pontibacter locisalis]|uniref:GAF domain-containing protein n=1 Tax=Pontibacter locisalis TaxID=1719035 RepID=A0ABW5IH65_9BACT
MQTTPSSILSTLRNTAAPVNWKELLTDIIATFDCSTGTLHTYNRETKLLELKAEKGIPPFLLPKMTEIPVGKGMAGIAAERKKPVEMCNLQTDTSGVARPAAKETKVEGSIAVPMLLDGELYGTLGIAKPLPYDFTEEEKSSLLQIGEEMSRYLRTNATANQG